MFYHCTICYDSLINDTEVPACLSCGHTYHKSCITQWMSTKTSPQCPLCKKKVVKSKMITPMYLSTNDDVATLPVDNSTANSVALTELTVKISQLQQEKLQLNGGLDALNREAAESREEISRLRLELCRAQTQRRYIKIIKKVAELDDELSDEHIQKYLTSIQSLPSTDLLVHVGALRVRQLKATKEAELATKRYLMKSNDVELLKAKVSKLNEQIRGGKTSAPSPPSTSPSHTVSSTSLTSTRTRPPKNVIILDSDDDDDDDGEETLNLTAGVENDDDDLEFLVEEHVPLNLNSRKRRNNFYEGHRRPDKIIAIDLSQDEGDSVAGSSSRYSS